jgi:hypothetical protein
VVPALTALRRRAGLRLVLGAAEQVFGMMLDADVATIRRRPSWRRPRPSI